MPLLKKEKWERFAKIYAKGVSAAQAYSEAGYSKDAGNAFKLANRPEVKVRIQEWKEVYREQDGTTFREFQDDLANAENPEDITKQFIMKELYQALQKAKSDGNLNAQLKCIDLLGKILGIFQTGSGRKKAGTKDDDSDNNNEPKVDLSQVASILGEIGEDDGEST